MKASTYVQIASYRDPQLIPTIEDLLRKAKNPDALTFGVCRQYHPDDGFDDLDAYKKDKRFRIFDVLYNEARGVCWARNLVQQAYVNEAYTLQIDSHMRFIEGWDEHLIEMITQLRSKGIEKPLLTGYMPSFDPDQPFDNKLNGPPLQMEFDHFTDDGIALFKSGYIKNHQLQNEPIPAKFYSGHFCFTLGAFSREVQHDPELYFHGEEISIAARAYTHGYDLFHPHQTIALHEYTRKYRVKHWDDDKTWSQRNRVAIMRTRQLLNIDDENADFDFGKYGFGQMRSLTDYEEYAGIQFAARVFQKKPVAKETFSSLVNDISSIRIIDDLITDDMLCEVYDLIDAKGFKYGWKSNRGVEFSHWNLGFLKTEPSRANRDNITVELPAALKTLWEKIQPAVLPEHSILLRAYCNAYTYGTEGYVHTDSKFAEDMTAIIFLNKSWDVNWAGETVLFQNDEIIKAVMPKSNRLFIFPSNIKHAARGVSRFCPELRIVLVFKAGKK